MDTVKRDSKGRFLKGSHSSIKTQFKKGQHPSVETEFKNGNILWKNANTEKSQWKKEGFKPFYLKEWNKKEREKIRKRDNYTCHVCGITEKELKGVVKKLHTHHKDGNKKNNCSTNLITLCNSCHLRIHAFRKHKLLFNCDILS